MSCYNLATDIPGDKVSSHIGRQQLRLKVAARCDGTRKAEHASRERGTWHLLALCSCCCLASLGLSRQRLLGFMGHDCASIIVAREAAPHARPGVSQGLAAHVLDTLGEVALMPLLAVPAMHGPRVAMAIALVRVCVCVADQTEDAQSP